MMWMDRAALAAMMDFTLLRPEATASQIRALCQEAHELGVYAVCVSPTFVLEARRTLADLGSPVKIATVCGFPSGAVHTRVKVAEAANAVTDGADEIDMVVNLAFVKSADWAAVTEEIAAVRGIAPGVVLKVIMESAALTDEEIRAVCRAAEAAGADFVKTSTGFHPAGGSTAHAVTVMRAQVGDRLGVKASGGLRTPADVTAVVAAGASRLGVSAAAEILRALT